MTWWCGASGWNACGDRLADLGLAASPLPLGQHSLLVVGIDRSTPIVIAVHAVKSSRFAGSSV
jgi:hypothetical protein